MKQLLFLLVLWMAQSGFATDFNALQKTYLNKDFLKISMVPEHPKVGETATIFFQPRTVLTNHEFVLEADLNTSNLKVTQAANDTWVGYLKTFNEVKENNISIDIYVQDAKEAQRIRSARSSLNKDIIEIEDKLLIETNPQKIQKLLSEKDEKQKYRDQLLLDLDALKKILKTENFSFQVEADSTNTNYPYILDVTPKAVPIGKRIVVQILGQNFPPNPVVKIGSQNAAIQSISSNQITVLAPNFSTTGSKNIEIIFAALNDNPKKNAILKDNFFASDVAILKNIRPVVVTTGFVRVTQAVPVPISLSAENSYDENGDSFDFEWSLTRVPTGSSLTVGSLLENTATPSFTPDLKGVYTFRVKTIENSTEDLLNSLNSTVTVEVR